MSWPVVKLGEVATLQRDGIGPAAIESGTRYLGLEHIEAGGRIIGGEAVESGDLASTKFRFGPEHVLYGKLRPYLAKIALPDFSGVCSTDILPVLPSDRLDRRYLAYFLRQPDMVEFANGRATGANLPRLSPKSLASFEIPLPPLAEQKRIAAILDQAARLTRLRAEALAKLDRLGQAIFREMFGDGAGNASESGASPLSELADIASGITKGRKLNGEATRPIAYMAVSNVQDQHLNLSVVKEIDATETEIARYRLLRGDLLLTEGGDPDKLGRGCLWNNEVDACIHQNHVFRVRITNERVRPIFLQWFVGSPISKRYFFKSAKQTTGIASINKTQLGALPVFVPSMDEQIRLETRLSSLEAAKRGAQSSAAQAQTLFASLQHRAFRGEL